MFRFAKHFGIFATLAAGSLASGATATSTMAVSATVISSCSVVAAPMLFGNYDAVVGSLSNPLPGTSILTVLCTSGAPATITLGQGANAAGGSTDAAPARRLKGTGSDYLSYGLYQDAAYATPWGNTTSSGKALTGAAAAQLVTVYGKIDPGQNVGAGAYNDSVVVTINF